MKNRYVFLFLYLFIGLLAGSLVNHLLASVQAVSFLTKTLELSWHPAANFDFVKYDLSITVKISLFSLLGMIAGIWIYRRTK